MLATCAHKAWWALADGPGEVGVAGPSVLAGHATAGVRADATVFAWETKRARAGEAVDAIHAGACVLAGVTCAVVYVYFATWACESGAASACQFVTQIETMATFKEKKARRVLKSQTTLKNWPKNEGRWTKQ